MMLQGRQRSAFTTDEVTQIPGWAPSVSLEVRDHVETGEEDEEAPVDMMTCRLRA